MQWLIDIIKEWVLAQEYRSAAWIMARIEWAPKFFDRGDPTDWDWFQGDFIIDNAWHDLDLSAIVPAGAKAVLIHTLIQANAVHRFLKLRKKGNVNEHNKATLGTYVADINHNYSLIVNLDSNRMIQYKITPATWLYVRLVVGGWWF